MSSVVYFTTEDGTKEKFFVVEETKLNDIKYLLVSDTDESKEEGNAYILKEVREEGKDAVYEMVEDDTEFDAIADIFGELLGEDADLVD